MADQGIAILLWIGISVVFLVVFLRAQVTGSRTEPGRTTPESRSLPASAPQAPPESSARVSAAGNDDLEEALFASRWLVWLGGVALALGGGFLVKYSIEHGYLDPRTRVILSGLFGLMLVVLGEVMRRRPNPRAVALLGEQTIAPALTAAGLLSCYAAAFGAHALYGLIGPAAAFALLAAVSCAGVFLSLLHGPFIGALGLAGAYAVPVIVSTREPSTLALFSYLGVVNLAALLIVRLRQWWWLGWVVLGAGGLWAVLVMQAPFLDPRDLPVTAVYAFSLGLSFAVVVGTAPATAEEREGEAVRTLALLGSAAGAALLLKLVIDDGFTELTVISAFALILMYSLTAAAGQLNLLALVSGGFALIMMLSWPYRTVAGLEVQPAFAFLPVFRPDRDMLIRFAGAVSALFFSLGFAASYAGKKPPFWASVSAGMPIAAFIILYGRLEHFGRSVPWSVAAVVLAGLSAGAAALLVTRRGAARPSHVDPAIAAYVVGTTLALDLACVMRLEQAWLTVALALQLPVLAWVYDRLRIPVLRGMALLLGVIVIVRLLLNSAVLDYPVATEIPLVNWITYGYGLPAFSALIAARLFARTRPDSLTVHVLQAAAYAFSVVLVTLQIRVLMQDGDLDAPDYGLLEASLYTVAWFAMSYGIYRRLSETSGIVIVVGTRILFWFAAAHFLFGHVFARIVFFYGTAVGAQPVLNLLLLAYGIPALFAGLFLHTTGRLPSKAHVAPTSLLMAGFCGTLLLYEGLEVRRAFHGSHLARGVSSGLEFYTYSAVWLLTALTIMVAGFLRRSRRMRFAGLAMLTIVVLKVFLFDMAGLRGLLRVISFMGLGTSLIFIGFIYQRFVLAAEKADGGNG